MKNNAKNAETVTAPVKATKAPKIKTVKELEVRLQDQIAESKAKELPVKSEPAPVETPKPTNLKFPMVACDFKSGSEINNVRLLADTVITLRKDEWVWRSIEKAYKTSKYSKYIGWQKVYNEAMGKTPPPAPKQKKPKAEKSKSTQVNGYGKLPSPTTKDLAKDLAVQATDLDASKLLILLAELIIKTKVA